MKIEEAIKELNTLKLPIKTEQDHRRHQAIRLGIEALKRVKDLRRVEPPFTTAEAWLPSETKGI